MVARAAEQRDAPDERAPANDGARSPGISGFGAREVWSSVLMARVNGDRSGAGVGHAVAERVPGRRPCRPATSRVAGCHGSCFTEAKGRATLRSYPRGGAFGDRLARSP